VRGPEEVNERQLAAIGAATYNGGHHTVYQHAHFEFGLEAVSRQFVWNFLHSYPFYNSEQSSQRYVKLGEVRAYVPPLEGEALGIYQRQVNRAWDTYRELSELLLDDTRSVLDDLRHVTDQSTDRKRKRVAKEAEKKAIEIARYVIPVAAFTSMVHTISGITLHRLARLMHSGDTPRETALVISRMVDAVRQVDPDFFERIGDPPLETDEVPEFVQRGGMESETDPSFKDEFDRSLEGRMSVLVSHDERAESIVADAYRLAMGYSRDQVGDDEALQRIMDPALNPYRLDKLNVTFHSPLTRPLHHARYTFYKRISHTADSQEQRHRMVHGSRPQMLFTDSREPDYITPMLLQRNQRARAVYQRAMQDAWDAKNALLDRGVPREDALYLLPNAAAIRFVESGDLLFLLHKWVMRTCFNAQEEIYQSAMEEVEQVRAVHPRLMERVGPPCVVRVGLARPICTEGDHFCGVPVWLDFPDVERRI
jgi:thymidylate synthase ThyX